MMRTITTTAQVPALCGGKSGRLGAPGNGSPDYIDGVAFATVLLHQWCKN